MIIMSFEYWTVPNFDLYLPSFLICIDVSWLWIKDQFTKEIGDVQAYTTQQRKSRIY